MQLFDRKRSYLKRSGVTTQGRREVEVGTVLLINDENNIIVKNVSSYF